MMFKYIAAQMSSVKGHASSKYRHFYPLFVSYGSMICYLVIQQH